MMYIIRNAPADTVKISDLFRFGLLLVIRPGKRDDDGDISGGDGNDGCCCRFWWMIKDQMSWQRA